MVVGIGRVVGKSELTVGIGPSATPENVRNWADVSAGRLMSICPRCRNGPAFASIARLVAVPQNDGVEPESERSAPSILKGIVDATGTIVREVKIASEPAVLV